MKRILTTLILLVPALAFGADDEDEKTELSVKPSLCIVDRRTPNCDMSFQIAWHSGDRGYYCIKNDLEDEPLRCWSEQRAGETTDERSVAKDFSYTLNEGEDEDQPPLDAVTVEVVKVESDDRRRKRRTRHVWDLL